MASIVRVVKSVDRVRRRWLTRLLVGGGAFTLGGQAARAAAAEDTLRFPGDPPAHKVVYQLNQADAEYQDHVIFSVGAMLRQYGDSIKIVVVGIGPGIHPLLKKPQRAVSQTIREKVSSLAQYGVEFQACGNTLKSLNMTEKDILPFARYVEVGAAALMELQEQGYAYISW